MVPIASGFAVREPGRREVLVCSELVSLFAGLGVSGTLGLGVGAASKSDWPDLFLCEGLGLFSRSAASAPDIRICSSVGSEEARFFSRAFGFVGGGVVSSEGLSSAAGVACLEGSGLVSRATITSCACIRPMRIKPQTRAPKNPLSIKRRGNQLQPVNKPVFKAIGEFSQSVARPGSPARENASVIRLPDKFLHDAIRTAETVRRQNNGR
jgi:hypothetical protein